jgi:oligopeptidase A
MNPLTNALLDFAAIRPEHIAPAVDELLITSQAALDMACSNSVLATWHDLSKTLDVATERFGVAWSAISHLNSVADTPELRAAYNQRSRNFLARSVLMSGSMPSTKQLIQLA